MKGVLLAVVNGVGRIWILGALMAAYSGWAYWNAITGGLIGPVNAVSIALLCCIGIVICANYSRGDGGFVSDSVEARVAIGLILPSLSLWILANFGLLAGGVVAVMLAGFGWWVCRGVDGLRLFIRIALTAFPLGVYAIGAWLKMIFGGLI